MSDLIVRAYNVLFGDAILISIPDRASNGSEVVRHILIDVGNLLASQDDVFIPVVRDITDKTGGEVDLYVMTHEHLDHVQGLLTAKNKGIELSAKHAWLTGSAAEDYYDTHDEAKKKKHAFTETFKGLVEQHASANDPWLTMMIQNNSALLPEGALGLRLSTADYVDHLRTIAPESTHYVDRTTDLTEKHPFQEATLRILAPEEDTSDYYAQQNKPRLGAALSEGIGAQRDRPPEEVARWQPPVGVQAGAFYDLVQSRNHVNRQAIMEIDKAANNTSIVLEISWRGWKLLFAGDAEERSWHMMSDRDVLEPVHFVKISHHGSINGTVADILDTVFPDGAGDGKPRRALVSTHDDDWDSVPNPDTLTLYSDRGCQLFDTRDVDPGEFVEIVFEG
jgi:beta-lactamase superfamily II metal-dependent hydrolase